MGEQSAPGIEVTVKVIGAGSEVTSVRRRRFSASNHEQARRVISAIDHFIKDGGLMRRHDAADGSE